MKAKSWFSIFGYSIKVALFFGIAGLFIGGCLISGYLIPPWESSTIMSTRDEIIDILYVNDIYLYEGYTDDEIYVKIKSGEIYSIYKNEWNLVSNSDDNLEKGQFQFGSNFDANNCIGKWRYKPPVKKGVIDSYGVMYERPLSNHSICYVLFDDGSIQLWTRMFWVGDLINTTKYSVLVGLIIGGIIGVYVKNKRIKQSGDENIISPENDI